MIKDPILYAHNPKQHIDNHNTQDNPYHMIYEK